MLNVYHKLVVRLIAEVRVVYDFQKKVGVKMKFGQTIVSGFGFHKPESSSPAVVWLVKCRDIVLRIHGNTSFVPLRYNVIIRQELGFVNAIENIFQERY